MKFSKYFIVILAGVFFILGFNTLQNSKPASKNERIYSYLKQHNPYYLEKRIGGFSILSKDDSIKEKPPITEVYHRLETLEQGWGMKHLKISNNTLNIYNDSNKLIDKIDFQNNNEKQWTQKYYNIK